MKHTKKITIEAITSALKKDLILHENDYIIDITIDRLNSFAYLHLDQRNPPRPGLFPKADCKNPKQPKSKRIQLKNYIMKKHRRIRGFLGYCFYCKYGHWCKSGWYWAIDHWLRGGKIKISRT
jgi:hypothetical protein